MKRAAFLDLDGVINRKPPEGECVTRWEEMQFLPGVPKAIGLLTGTGYCIFVAVNRRVASSNLARGANLKSRSQLELCCFCFFASNQFWLPK